MVVEVPKAEVERYYILTRQSREQSDAPWPHRAMISVTDHIDDVPEVFTTVENAKGWLGMYGERGQKYEIVRVIEVCRPVLAVEAE